MEYMDWPVVALGFVTGVAMSAVFFAGLGFGMRLALRSPRPVRLLLLSAAIRFSAFLVAGWMVLSQGGAWCFAGYAAAFLIVRFAITAVAKTGLPVGGS